MEDDTRIHQAVDEVSACIATARSVAGNCGRNIRDVLNDGKSRLDQHGDEMVWFVVGMYEGLIKDISHELDRMQSEADKAQAAVKYLGAQE